VIRSSEIPIDFAEELTMACSLLLSSFGEVKPDKESTEENSSVSLTWNEGAIVGDFVGSSVVGDRVTDGFFEGSQLGLKVGVDDVGLFVGILLGTIVETIEGAMVGLSEGLAVGASDGLIVGKKEGCSVGASVGTIVGNAVGHSEGTSVVGVTEG
jgi:hypothetical protein